MLSILRFSAVFSAIAVLALVLLAGCGGQSGQLPEDQSGTFAVPWPGDGEATRTVSDDSILLDGNLYAAIGGDAVENGTTVEFTGGGNLPYTIYTLGGFSPQIQIGSVTLNATATEGSPDDGTQLYVGLAKYTTNSWEWFAADSGGWTSDPLVSAQFVSPAGNVSMAVVLDGPGTAVVNNVEFARKGDTTLSPPDTVTGSPLIASVTVSWSEVAAAAGYNVYRDTEPSMASAAKINATPVADTSYKDSDVTSGVMYYYQVTSTAGIDESAKSDLIDVFVPEINLAFPLNPRIVEIVGDTATVAWDWVGPPPSDFQLYLEDHLNFNLVSPIQSPTVDGADREYVFRNLQAGTQYRWRVCPVFASKRGNMTDDAAISEGGSSDWSWGPIETLGNGEGPVVVVNNGSGLAAAYLNAGDLMVATRTSGTWTPTVAITGTSIQYHLDLSYNNGKYGAVGYAVTPGDLWAATGAPGAWTSERVHGDGDTALGHPNSGINCRIAVTSDKYVVIHTDRDSDNTLAHTKPTAGGTWTTSTVRGGASNDTPYHMEALGANAYLLMKDLNSSQVLFGDLNSGWSMATAIAAGAPAVFNTSDLVNFGGNWVSPLRDATNDRFILARSSTTPWSIEEISSEDTGSNARMAVDGSKAAIVFSRSGGWGLAFTDGGPWELTDVVISGNSFGSRPDIAFLGGSPFLVYPDGNSGNVKAAKGTPPS